MLASKIQKVEPSRSGGCHVTSIDSLDESCFRFVADCN